MTLISGCAAVTGDSAPETVLIGVDLELTGDGSALGQIYHNALQLRTEQVNELGLLGDRQIALEVRDNRSDAATAANNAAELAADPDVQVIITGGCGPCAVAIANAADQHGVPTIALAAPDAITEPLDSRQYMFKLGPNADHTAAALVRQLRAADAGSIGLVTVDDEYGEDGLSRMTSAAERAGIELGVTQRINASEESMQTAAAAVAAYQPDPPDETQEQEDSTGQDESAGQTLPPGQETQQPEDPGAEEEESPPGPDAVVVWTYASAVGEFAMHLREAGYEGPLFLDTIAADELFLVGQTGSALSGATMVFPETLVIDEVIATSPVRAARKNWFSDYSSRYGTYNAFSSFAADAIQVVVEAVNRAETFHERGEVDRAVLRGSIETIQLEGITGTIRMSPLQHSGLLPQALATLVARGDRWRLSG